jgi:hypothetical protein
MQYSWNVKDSSGKLGLSFQLHSYKNVTGRNPERTSKNPDKEVKRNMPKTLKELANAKRNVKKVGGKKIDFKAITQKIIESDQYWTVSEVHTQLVQKKVGRFRTMKLLNGACTVKKIERLYENGKFYYGPIPKQQ